MKKSLVRIAFGTMIAAVLLPLISFAARTSAPVLSGLFPSTTLSVNLPAPTNFSLGTATTSGTVYSNGNSALYFEVTAYDGVGESLGSTLLGTTTGNEAHGWKLTWTPVPGATAYRIYFSTSTPQAMTQYFTATTTSQYSFQSTSTATYVTAFPTSNTAYGVNFAVSGNSWLNGGNFGIGSTTPVALLSVQAMYGQTASMLFEIASSTSLSNSNATFIYGITRAGHVIASSTAPALSSCGTSPSINGDDSHGRVTSGTSNATGCTVTFAIAYTNAPACSVTNESATSSFAYAVSSTAITVTDANIGVSKFDYICEGLGGTQ